MYVDGEVHEGTLAHARSLRSKSRVEGLDDGLLAAVQSLVSPVVVFDPECKHHSIAASSAGFQRLTGYAKEDLLLKPPGVLLEGVPASMVSRSGWKNFAEYCRYSRDSGVAWMAESSTSHAFGRRDGSVFTSLMTLGHCAVQGRALVVAIYSWLGEGPVVPRLTDPRSTELEEINREVLRGVWQRVRANGYLSHNPAEGDPGPARGRISFYTERLHDRTIVFSGGASAARREPEELPIGCMLFGSAPLKQRARQDLGYTLRVDGTAQGFGGLPWVGFTRKEPVNSPGLYPRISKCLAQSVFVGGSGEATCRTREHNFHIGFGKIPQTEIATWSLQPEVPTHMRSLSAEVKVGDHIQCRYTCGGHIQFLLNGDLLLDFDVGCPPEVGADYWPVVDICSSVSAMTLLGLGQAAAGDDVYCAEAVAHPGPTERKSPHTKPVELREEVSILRSDVSTFVEVQEREPVKSNEAWVPRSDASTLASEPEQEGMHGLDALVPQSDESTSGEEHEQEGLTCWSVPARSDVGASVNGELCRTRESAGSEQSPPGLANGEWAKEPFRLLGGALAALAAVCAVAQLTAGAVRTGRGRV